MKNTDTEARGAAAGAALTPADTAQAAQGATGAPARAVFDRDAILKSRRWAHRRDALSFLLTDGAQYSHEDVEAILNDYMKGRVR